MVKFVFHGPCLPLLWRCPLLVLWWSLLLVSLQVFKIFVYKRKWCELLHIIYSCMFVAVIVYGFQDLIFFLTTFVVLVVSTSVLSLLNIRKPNKKLFNEISKLIPHVIKYSYGQQECNSFSLCWIYNKQHF